MDPKDKQVYMKKYHERNRQALLEQKKERVQLIKRWLKEQRDNPCSDCGKSFPTCCMEFHHLVYVSKGGGEKFKMSWGKKKIEAEIKKCVLVCACCHRIRHNQD